MTRLFRNLHGLIMGRWVDLVHYVASRALGVNTRRAIYIGSAAATLRWEAPISASGIFGARYAIEYDLETKTVTTVFDDALTGKAP